MKEFLHKIVIFEKGTNREEVWPRMKALVGEFGEVVPGSIKKPPEIQDKFPRKV